MVSKRMGAKLALILVALAVIFTACKSMPDTIGGMKIEPGKELAAWKGEWVSAAVVKNDSSLNAVYKEISSKMPYYTEEGLKAAVADMYASPVVSAKFDGTNTVMFMIQKRDGSKSEMLCEYKYIGKKAAPGQKDFFWEAFEAVTDTKELKSVKYLVLIPPDRHGDGLLHWHGRFSPYSISWIVEGDKSWPTYIPASTSKEAMVNNFENSIKSMPRWSPVSPFESYAAHGKWINTLSIFENTSKEVEAVYAKVIKEFAGKNPKGGDFTKAEIIAELQKGNKSVKDYSHLEFIVKDGKNELVFYKGDKEIFRSSYIRVAASPSKPYMTMKAERKDAGMYSLVSFVVVHGSAPMQHFHLWYGNNEKELEAFEGTPTCYRAALTNAEIAAAVEKSARTLLEELTKAKK